MSQKGLAPIVIVLLIALGIGGYLIYSGKINLNQAKPVPVQPTTQPSSASKIVSQDELMGDKKVYKHDKQWQISYPKDWHRLPFNNATPSRVSFSNGTGYPRDPESGSILVIVDWDTPSSWYESNLKKGGEKIKVDGYPAIKQVNETPPGSQTEYSYSVMISVRGPKDVRIEAFSLKDEKTENFFKPSDSFIKNDLPILDQILPTFKFNQ